MLGRLPARCVRLLHWDKFKYEMHIRLMKCIIRLKTIFNLMQTHTFMTQSTPNWHILIYKVWPLCTLRVCGISQHTLFFTLTDSQPLWRKSESMWSLTLLQNLPALTLLQNHRMAEDGRDLSRSSGPSSGQVGPPRIVCSEPLPGGFWWLRGGRSYNCYSSALSSAH